ncbi:MAG TPA: hypothetical protein PKV17_03540 [Aquabacterium sp.]|nr:hypothetical protein [Aquabacterium sp.]HRH27834.1 hypothetical protein [Aquabacterium sp.]
MSKTRKNAPGANDAQGQTNIERLDSVAQQDFTPEAAATALHATLHGVTRSLLCLTGGNPHASLIAAHTALKTLAAASDSLAVLVRQGA